MRFDRLNTSLVLGLALTLLHLGTNRRCLAAELLKTVEPSDPQVELPESGRMPAALLSLHSENGVFSHFAFLVDKKSRSLTVWENDGDKIKAVAAYPADLGAQPGDKMAEGDRRTPEGIYFIQNTIDGKKLDSEKYGERIFTLDYPNTFDRLEKKTGKGIWLHAISDKKSLQRGSHGCVVVRNKAIEELSKYIELKRTPLIVAEQVDYLNEKDWLESQRKLKSMLELWKEKRHLETGEEFQIKPDTLQIFKEGKKIVMRFIESEKTKAAVEPRVLYALRGEDGLEIISER